MANIFDVDFSEPQVQKAITQSIGQLSRELYRTAPKRAIVCYLRLIMSLPLWLYPIGRSHPLVSLSSALMALAATAKTSDDLEKLQASNDDTAATRKHAKVLQQVAIEQVSETEQYAAVAQHRLKLSQGLPAHLVEPDLLPPAEKGKQGDDFERFKAFLGEKKPAADRSTSDSEASEQKPVTVGASQSTAKASAAAPVPQANYRFYTRQNGRTKLDERAVDLSGHDSYAGLPIVDVAQLMAVDERGVLGVGSTGCGKSRLLANAISIQQSIDNTTDFTVFAHKSANDARGQQLNFAGMENSKDCFVFTATQTGEDLHAAAQRFEYRLAALTALLEKGSLCTSVVVIDQSNQGFVACDRSYKQAKKQRAHENAGLKRSEQNHSPIDFATLGDDYQNFINSGLVDGREKAVKLWNLGHANTNESMGVEHQIKRNVAFIGLGRSGNYQAVWNPLKDKRFIEDDEVRDKLSAQLAAFLSAHKANGSPANVVVAITNLGVDGWRLVVLPQYEEHPRIVYNVVNPESEQAPPPPAEEMRGDRPPVDRAEQLRSLERSVNYTSEQLVKTRQLVSWFKSAGGAYVENGTFHPRIAQAIPFIESEGEMQICLDILCSQGVGEFVDNQMRWRPLGALAKVIPMQAQPAASVTREAMREALTCLARLQAGSITEPKQVLDNSRKLRQQYGMTVPLLNKVLGYLETRGIVRYPTSDRRVFEYRGGLDDF